MFDCTLFDLQNKYSVTIKMSQNTMSHIGFRSVPVILSYFHDVFIYVWGPFCINMGGIARTSTKHSIIIPYS